MATVEAVARRQVDSRVAGRSRKRRRIFFTAMAIAMLVVVALGFGRSFFLRPIYIPQPLPFYLVVHGIVMTAWFLLFLAQALLVSARRTDLHRKLGIAGLLVAAAIVVTGIMVNLNVASRMLARGEIAQLKDGMPFALASLSSLIPFVILIVVAMRMRRRPQVHKRLMFWAAVWILGPAFTNTRPIGEVLDPLVAPHLPFFPADLFWLVALVAYDLVTARRIHSATAIPFVLLLAYFLVVTPLIAGSEVLQGWLLAFAQGSRAGG